MMTSIPKNQITSRGTMEQQQHEEAAWAKRVLQVDETGNPYNASNRFPVDVIITPGGGITTPTIFNVTATLANTEYSQALPTATKQFFVKVRDGLSKLQLAFNPGDSATNYVTVAMGSVYIEENVSLTGKTLYFRTNKPGQVIEILAWT